MTYEEYFRKLKEESMTPKKFNIQRKDNGLSPITKAEYMDFVIDFERNEIDFFTSEKEKEKSISKEEFIKQYLIDENKI